MSAGKAVGKGGGKGTGKGAAKTDGRQQRWAEHKRERRQMVVDAAIDVIEQHPPGETIHVQQIADRAGIHRTVLYRHFEDRTDLDLAVQTAICQQAGAELFASMSMQGTPREITFRVVETYIRWAAAHPALVRFAERDLGGDVVPLEQALEQVAEGIELLITSIIQMLGVELPQKDRDALDPFVFGLIGGGFQATKRWANRDTVRPPIEDFVELLGTNIWRQVTGIALDRGVEIPDVPVEQLLGLADTSGGEE